VIAGQQRARHRHSRTGARAPRVAQPCLCSPVDAQAGFARVQAGFARAQAGFARAQAGFASAQAGFVDARAGRARAQDMKKRGRYGHVINVSSMSGHRVPPGAGAFYAATKHALRALTEGLRQEARAARDAPVPRAGGRDAEFPG